MKQMSDLQAAVLAKPGSKVTYPVSDSTFRTSKPAGLSVPVTRGRFSTPSSYVNWKFVTGPPDGSLWSGASLSGGFYRRKRGACLSGPPRRGLGPIPRRSGHPAPLQSDPWGPVRDDQVEADR